MSLFGVTLFNIHFHISKPEVSDKANGKQIICFVGPTGSGKSRLLNYLMGSDLVLSKRSFSSVTQDLALCNVKLSCEEAKIKEEMYTLVDTQGLMDTQLSHTQTLDIVRKSIKKNVTRMSRMVIVFKGTDRFNEPNIKALRDIIDNFQLDEGDRKQHVLIVFTHCESIKKGDIDRLKKEILEHPQIKRIFCEQVINRISDGTKRVIDNIVFIGIPNPDDYDDDLIRDIYREKLELQRETLWGYLQIHMKLIETRASFSEKYCVIL